MTLILGLVFLALAFHFAYRRWTRPQDSWQPALLVLSLIALFLAIGPWRPTSLLEAPLTDIHVFLIDVSESMGPAPDELVSRDFLELPATGRLILIACGTKPQICFDGQADDFPDRLRPGVLDQSVAQRARANMLEAIREACGRMDSQEQAHLHIVSDGGFERLNPALVLSSQNTKKIASVESLDKPRFDFENLAVEIVGNPRRFLPGTRQEVEIRVHGYQRDGQSFSVELSWQDGSPKTRQMNVPKGFVDVRFQMRTGPLASTVSELVARLGLKTAKDARPKDNEDRLPLIAVNEQPLVLLLEGKEAQRFPLEALNEFQVSRDPSDLARANLVVIHDWHFEKDFLEPQLWRELEQSVLGGTGLFLSGAQSAFALGVWQDSKLDALSPLAAQPGRKKRVLVVALDQSGSMEQKKRFRRAAEVVQETFSRLADGDRLVLLPFAEQTTKFEFRRGDKGAMDALRACLRSIRPQGGTNLAGMFDELLGQNFQADEHALAFVLTDGQDPQAMRPDRLSRWRKSLNQQSIDLRVFWFDRDEALRPLLTTLVDRVDKLIAVDDFGALARPFFEAIDETLVVQDRVYFLESQQEVLLPRVLRTRPQEGAEILAEGEEQVVALAKIRRGLGQVAAAPVDLKKSASAGLWLGEKGLKGFLKSLLNPTGASSGTLALRPKNREFQFVLENEPNPAAKGLRFEGDFWDLSQEGPKRLVSEPDGRISKGGVAQILGAEGAIVGRIPFRFPHRQDLGPQGQEDAVPILVKKLRSWSKDQPRPSSISVEFLALAFLLLCFDMAYRARGA